MCPRLLVFTVSLLFLGGCASTKVVSWHGSEFSLTCQRGFGEFRGKCGEEDWAEEAAKVCPTYQLVGQSTQTESRGISGYVDHRGNVYAQERTYDNDVRTYNCANPQ